MSGGPRGWGGGKRDGVGAGQARSAGGSDREVGDPWRRLFAVRAQDPREGGASGGSLHMALNICRDISGAVCKHQRNLRAKPKRERISCSHDVRAHVSILNRECSFLIQLLVLFIHLSLPTSTMSISDRWIKKEHSRFKVLA
jgi:hypothetical protein